MHTVKELSWSAVARGPGSGMVCTDSTGSTGTPG